MIPRYNQRGISERVIFSNVTFYWVGEVTVES